MHAVCRKNQEIVFLKGKRMRGDIRLRHDTDPVFQPQAFNCSIVLLLRQKSPVHQILTLRLVL